MSNYCIGQYVVHKLDYNKLRIYIIWSFLGISDIKGLEIVLSNYIKNIL